MKRKVAMSEPVSGMLIGAVLKKLGDLFGDALLAKLRDRRPAQQKEMLLDLFTQLRTIEKSILQLVGMIDALIENPEDHSLEGAAKDLYKDLTKALLAISHDLNKLAPRFEIMAKDAAELIFDFTQADEGFLYSFGLLRQRTHQANREDLEDYRSRLADIRRQARDAREAVSAFIRKEYTWATL